MKTRLAALTLGGLLCATHVGATELIPLEILAKLPQFSNPQLSPNGEYFAATVTANGEPVVIIQKRPTEADKKGTKPAVVDSGKIRFSWYDWANDERLIITTRSTTTGFNGDYTNLTRMGSVHRDGKDPVFFDMEPNNWGFYRQHVDVISWVKDDDDHILAQLDDEPNEWATPQVHRINVNTGARDKVLRNRRGVFNWLSDESGRIRVGTKFDTTLGRRGVTIFYRETENSDWETLQKVDYFDHDRLEPYRFEEDDSSILLVTSANLQDELDPDEIESQLFSYDLNSRRLLGRYENQHRKMVLETVENALPDLKVRISSRDWEKETYFMRVFSDVRSPEYFILDLKKKSLEYAASQYPDLIDYELAPMERLTYKARDDLDIPAFLTVPNGVERKDLAIVVHPHGGPWAHDRWGFDNYVQFFANRGYAVFQPQFRGSTGYGIAHEEAGYGQWGYTIQDDITDGVTWLIEQGIADPDRICIVGSSFGGYAAAMGIAKTPELYRCAVSINGVLDLKMFIGGARNSLFETINRAVWNSREDAENASPYHMAEKITAPLLLIGSERDTVVTIKHSKRMYKKLKRLDKPVDFIELPDGEHWRTNEANEIAKFKALETFLAEHIGPNSRTRAN